MGLVIGVKGRTILDLEKDFNVKIFVSRDSGKNADGEETKTITVIAESGKKCMVSWLFDVVVGLIVTPFIIVIQKQDCKQAMESLISGAVKREEGKKDDKGGWGSGQKKKDDGMLSLLFFTSSHNCISHPLTKRKQAPLVNDRRGLDHEVSTRDEMIAATENASNSLHDDLVLDAIAEGDSVGKVALATKVS